MFLFDAHPSILLLLLLVIGIIIGIVEFRLQKLIILRCFTLIVFLLFRIRKTSLEGRCSTNLPFMLIMHV